MPGRSLEQLANNSSTRVTWSVDDYTLMTAFLALHKITREAQLELYHDDMIHLALDLGYDKEEHSDEKHWVQGVRRRMQSSMKYRLEKMREAKHLRKRFNADHTLEVWEWSPERVKACLANARLVLKGRQEDAGQAEDAGQEEDGAQDAMDLDSNQDDGAVQGGDGERGGEDAAEDEHGVTAAAKVAVIQTWPAFRKDLRRPPGREAQVVAEARSVPSAPSAPSIITISSGSDTSNESSNHGFRDRSANKNGQDAAAREDVAARQHAAVGGGDGRGVGDGDSDSGDSSDGDSDSNSCNGDSDSDGSNSSDVDGDARARVDAATRILQLRHQLIDAAMEGRLRRLGLGGDDAGRDGINSLAAYERQEQRWEALEEAVRELPRDDIWTVGGSWELFVRGAETEIF
ncbi:hypothetical protein N0V92_011635 [Colletotrichum tropicale]|nr:hypothetical protein N0V92_011635 [Colletotrichum tropicale]